MENDTFILFQIFPQSFTVISVGFCFVEASRKLLVTLARHCLFVMTGSVTGYVHILNTL